MPVAELPSLEELTSAILEMIDKPVVSKSHVFYRMVLRYDKIPSGTLLDAMDHLVATGRIKELVQENPTQTLLKFRVVRWHKEYYLVSPFSEKTVNRLVSPDELKSRAIIGLANTYYVSTTS